MVRAFSSLGSDFFVIRVIQIHRSIPIRTSRPRGSRSNIIMRSIAEPASAVDGIWTISIERQNGNDIQMLLLDPSLSLAQFQKLPCPAPYAHNVRTAIRLRRRRRRHRWCSKRASRGGRFQIEKNNTRYSWRQSWPSSEIAFHTRRFLAKERARWLG